MATIDLDFPQIVQDSIGAAKKELGTSFSKLKPFAEHEFTQFAENAAFLAKLKLEGTIGDDELKARLNIQRLALNNDLLAIEGIGILTAQNIVNDVLDIVTAAVKKAAQVILPI